MRLKESEMAEFLNLPVSTINRWVRQGRIPIQKKGAFYTFEQGALERWADIHKMPVGLPNEKTEGRIRNQLRLSSLLSAMQRGGMIYDVPGEGVTPVLRESVERMNGLPEYLKPEVFERLEQREQLSSTGIGKGVAIPHPRNPNIEVLVHPLITTCFPEKEVDFNAVDNRPVFVLFILLSPTAKQHLHLLSRLSYCLRDDRFVTFLKNRPLPESLYDRISKIEAALEEKETV